MTDTSKVFIKNIPEGFPDDKVVEILKKQFENGISSIHLYKHQHKFKNKLNKICFFTVSSNEVKQKVFEFLQSFELIDQRGIKHKLRAANSLLPSELVKAPADKIENTIGNLAHFIKFQEFLTSGKLIDFKQEEDKFVEGLYDGVEERKKETPVINERTIERERMVQTKGAQQGAGSGGKKIIMNKEKRVENFDANLSKFNEAEVLVEGPSYSNKNSIFTANKGYNDNNTQVNSNSYFNKGGGSYKDNYNNNNNYRDNYNSSYNYKDNYNNNYKDNTNYNSSSYGNNYKGGNNYNTSGGYNNNSGYNNNYSNNGGYYEGNEGYYDNSNYNKKGNRYYKK